MGIFGLSNKAVSFLGGVASGVEKTVDREQKYTNDLVKDTSGIVIKARLDSKSRRTERVNEFRQDISELVSLGYGKQEAAAIVKQNRKSDFAEIAKTTPKDQLNTVFKVSNAYDGDTPLSISDLAQAVAGRYAPPDIDLSNLPKRKTFLSAIGIDDDPTEKIKNRVDTLTPKDKESDVDFDKLAGLLSGETTPFGREKLRKDTGSLSATSVEGKFRTYITEKLGGTVSYISGQPVYKLDQREDRMYSTVLTADFLDRWRDLTKGDNRISKEKAYKQLIDEISKDSSITPFKKKDVGGDGKVDPKNLIPEKPKGKGDKIPEIKIIKRDDSKIAAILKEQITGDLENKFKKLDTSGKAKFRQKFIKQLVTIGGMDRQEAIELVKKYYP